MPRYANIDEYTDECLFRIGQRVRVEIAPDIWPIDEVLCNTGIVQKIKTRFMLTPKMRDFTYTVWLDGAYHKQWDKSMAIVNQHQISEVYHDDLNGRKSK